MNPALTKAFDKLLDIMKKDSRCLGAWYYGSLARELDDEYSDIDVVFLIDSNFFESFGTDIPKIVSQICDELVIVWPESYNCDELQNHGLIIKAQEQLFQLDFFTLNNKKHDSWIARNHYIELTPSQVIFDKGGEVAKFVAKSPKGNTVKFDVIHLIKTYWFHLHMLIKYFLRNDFFKLQKNINIIQNVHTELLLTRYDQIHWGDYCNKIKQCVPLRLQEHLKKYTISEDIEKTKTKIKECADYFSADAQNIAVEFGLKYPINMETSIKNEFINYIKVDNK